jgi:hypothetical protein
MKPLRNRIHDIAKIVHFWLLDEHINNLIEKNSAIGHRYAAFFITLSPNYSPLINEIFHGLWLN